jgi:hypothetical protein
VAKITINSIIIFLWMVVFFSMAKGIIITISTSKIINKISTMKYWFEKGILVGCMFSNPHSNMLFFVSVVR